MSFAASRSAQALRAASRRAPRVANVATKSQRASYSLLARAAASAPSKAPVVQVGTHDQLEHERCLIDLPTAADSWSQDS